MAPQYRDFLEAAALLMTAKERSAFLALGRDYQRDEFIQRFWEMRNPDPQAHRNLFMETWQERVVAARNTYGTLNEDRAKMLLEAGPPARSVRIDCRESLHPIEVWIYEGSGLGPGHFTLVFYQPQGAVSGPYRLWRPGDGVDALLAIQALSRGQGLPSLEGCPGGSDLTGFLSEAADGDVVVAKLHLIPHPGDEWLSRFSSFSTDLPAGAVLLPATVDFSFPGRNGNRIVTQGLINVPRSASKVREVGSESAFSFALDGEVLREDELLEHFHYRFNLAEPQVQGNAVPLVFERYLRPGTYTVVLKLEDLGGERYFREQRQIEVPPAPTPAEAAPPAATSASAAAPPAAGGSAPSASSAPAARRVLAEANASLPVSDATVRLLSPAEGLLTGSVRLEAIAAGSGIARVSFLLDGRPVLSKSRAPYSVAFNLGREPRTHRVKAIAMDASGQPLAEDVLVLNAGPHRFALRLTDPQPGHTYRSSLRAQAQVQLPEDESLDRLEFYLNENLVSTLYQPPFVQPILLADTAAPSYVRAIAYLEDGSTAEDLVLINSPNAGERVDVEFVELYTTVTDHHGRPVEGLNRADFKVYEDGSEQAIRRFELVRDLPIHAGVLIDTSGSMATKLDAAIQGALGFFKQVIKPRDRAAVFTFSSEPNLAVRFTHDTAALAAGLEGLHAEGNTVLYDTIIEALYYFGGIRGKRAIVLLTDGRDEGSKYQYKDALDYARQSGVAFYTVGIGLAPTDSDVHFKLRELAEETGGRSFFIEHPSALKEIYAAIEGELRSQYLVAYQSSKGGNDGTYRNVQVKLDKPGLEARTIRGYTP